MFTLPTPKYNDYAGTPLEELSKIELTLSMQVAQLAMKAIVELLGPEINEKTLQKRIIQVWSLLHGMISLNNSQVMGYVVDKPEALFDSIIDELAELVSLWQT